MSSDWWAKKLGGQPQQDKGGPPPATQPPKAPTPQQTPMQRQAAQSGLDVRPDAQTAPQSVEEGAARLFDRDSYEGVRRKSVETGNDGICPECGEATYFENIRSNERGATAGKPASPRCTSCGFPITHGLNAS